MMYCLCISVLLILLCKFTLTFIIDVVMNIVAMVTVHKLCHNDMHVVIYVLS